MNQSSANKKPWYREPWPWFLMSGPALVVVAAIFTAWLAVRSSDGLVDDDYYKQGLAVDKQMARSAEALDLGLSAEVVFGGDGSDLRLFLTAQKTVAQPEILQLRIVHPTRAGGDQSVKLTKDAAGYYVGRLTTPLSGARWHLVLEDEGRHWRITGDWRRQTQGAARLSAAATVSN